MSMSELSLVELLQYKNVTGNQDMLPSLTEFYNANKNKFNVRNNNNNWKRPESRTPDNWLLANKFKQSDEEKLFSQFRSILNKLSESNFDELAKELTSLEINKQTYLAKLAEFIFSKALIEPKFSVMYAKLSSELSGCYVEEDSKVVHFRELLIERCQMMFNECVSFDPALINKTLVTKETAVGCMTFIGELYNCGLLTDKIINSCFLLLLMKSTGSKTYIIECICTLMRVVGDNFNKKCKNESKVIFDKISTLIKSNTLMNKDKFGLLDLLDMKQNNKW